MEPAAQARDELLQRLGFFRLDPRVIVDLGCGDGDGARALRKRYPRARVLAVDVDPAHAQRARRGQRFWRRFDCVCADGAAMPFAAQSVDLVFCSLMLPYCQDPPAVFAEVQRVLRPGGLLLFAAYGPDTAQALCSPGVAHLAGMPQLGAALAQAGLAEPVLDRDLQRTHASDGAAMNCEFIYGAAFAGNAHRTASGETLVPLGALRGRGQARS